MPGSESRRRRSCACRGRYGPPSAVSTTGNVRRRPRGGGAARSRRFLRAPHDRTDHGSCLQERPTAVSVIPRPNGPRNSSPTPFRRLFSRRPPRTAVLCVRSRQPGPSRDLLDDLALRVGVVLNVFPVTFDEVLLRPLVQV